MWSRLMGDPSPGGMFEVKTLEAGTYTGPLQAEIRRVSIRSSEAALPGEVSTTQSLVRSCKRCSDMMELDHAGRVSSHY